MRHWWNRPILLIAIGTCPALFVMYSSGDPEPAAMTGADHPAHCHACQVSRDFNLRHPPRLARLDDAEAP